MNDKNQIYKAIAAVSEKVNDLGKRLDDMMILLNEQRSADIDYIAMEADIDLDQEEEINNE